MPILSSNDLIENDVLFLRKEVSALILRLITGNPFGADVERLGMAAAARYLGMPESTLRWRRAMDKPPRSYKLGRRVWFDRRDLDAFIESESSKTERGVSV